MWFSLAVHANRINYFVTESLDAALQKPIFNFGSRSITIKLKQKQKGGRNLRNTLYLYGFLDRKHFPLL
jgi:hypothetical protein